jgi:hypothetical protein
MSNTRGSFKPISEYDLRSTAPNTIDTGIIPTPVTSTQTSGPRNRGMETNTARGVKQAPVITGITPVTYGPTSDAPVVEGFKVYGDN